MAVRYGASLGVGGYGPVNLTMFDRCDSTIIDSSEPHAAREKYSVSYWYSPPMRILTDESLPPQYRPKYWAQ